MHKCLALALFALALCQAPMAKSQSNPADPAASAQTNCQADYAKTSSPAKSLLGNAKDEIMAPMIDGFLAAYSTRYRSAPSYETYMDNLGKNWLSSADRPIYDLKQALFAAKGRIEFDRLMSIIVQFEQLAATTPESHVPFGQSDLEYIKCLRRYMAAWLKSLPPDSNYRLARGDLLAEIEPPENIAAAKK